VKVECAMQNKQINSIVTNHSLAPLPKEKQIRTLKTKEIKSSSKINLRDVSWWMSIKDAHKPRALIIARFSKKGCIFLVIGGRPFWVARNRD